MARGDGSYTRVLARLAKTDLLVIDDWGLAPLAPTERRDLLGLAPGFVDTWVKLPPLPGRAVARTLAD